MITQFLMAYAVRDWDWWKVGWGLGQRCWGRACRAGACPAWVPWAPCTREGPRAAAPALQALTLGCCAAAGPLLSRR